jgi:hypothetical protein
MRVVSLQTAAIRPGGIANLTGSHSTAAGAAPRLLCKQDNMAGLLRSWQRLSGLTARAVDSAGAMPAYCRSHRTVAFASIEEAVEEAAPAAEAPAGKVKRPPTAYSRYVADNYASAQAANPELKGVGAIGKVLGKQWAELPEAQKNEYKRAAEAAKADFDKQYPDGPPKAVRKVKDTTPKKDRVKRPPTPYNVFVKERLPIIRAEQGLGGAQAMSAAGKEWSQLSAVEKSRYRA